MHKDFENKKVYVATSKYLEDKDNVHPLLKIRFAHVVNEMPLLPLQATPLLKIRFAHVANEMPLLPLQSFPLLRIRFY